MRDKTLILCEKPSVAADFAKALQAGRREGFFESGNHVITFAFGHLLELFSPDDYDKSLGTWELSQLPILPRQFQFKPVASGKKQLAIIKQLVKRKDVGRYVIATDAGREGELIGREVLQYAGVDIEKARRFWSSEALSRTVIERGLANAKPARDYDALYQTGFFRALADWIVGMNYSRLWSLKLSGRYSVGRVQTAVLNLIVSREEEIRNFVEKKFWKVKVGMTGADKPFAGWIIEGDDNRFWSRDGAAGAIKDIAPVPGSGVVRSAKREQVKKNPPQLLNLTALQRTMNKERGMSAARTLEVAQKLYEEHKVLSYPRTPSRVMGSSDVGLAVRKMRELKRTYPKLFAGCDEELFTTDNKRVFNDAKLEDHHALIPLGQLPDGVGDEERAVYRAVLLVFAQAFHHEAVLNKVSYTIVAGKREIEVRGTSIISAGWLSIAPKASERDEEEDGEENAGDLPVLQEGETVSLDSTKIEEGKTRPPKRFDDSSLLGVMEKPDRYLGDDAEYEFEPGTGLGTPATRAAIIEVLFGRKYCERKKKAIVPTEKGETLVKALRATPIATALLDVQETARWETVLNEHPAKFFKDVQTWVREHVAAVKDSDYAAYQIEKEQKEILGTCPLCGGSVVETPKGFGCSRFREGCTFTIWKKVAGASITKAQARRLLAGEKVGPKKMMSRAGKPFEAFLILDSTEGRLRFEFEKQHANQR